MEYKFSTIEKSKSNPTFDEMISINDNSIYVSSSIRKSRGYFPGNSFMVMIDKEKKSVALMRTLDNIINSYKMDASGYIKIRLIKKIPKGRYKFFEDKEDLVIFKK
jgi:hypothetical protein